jgi:hypothetical protein
MILNILGFLLFSLLSGIFNGCMCAFVGIIISYVLLKTCDTRYCMYGGDNYVLSPGFATTYCVISVCIGSVIGFYLCSLTQNLPFI